MMMKLCLHLYPTPLYSNKQAHNPQQQAVVGRIEGYGVNQPVHEASTSSFNPSIPPSSANNGGYNGTYSTPQLVDNNQGSKYGGYGSNAGMHSHCTHLNLAIHNAGACVMSAVYTC